MRTGAAMRVQEESVVETYDNSVDKQAFGVISSPNDRAKLERFVNDALQNASKLTQYIVNSKIKK